MNTLEDLKNDLLRLKAQFLLAKGNWGHGGRPGKVGGSSSGGERLAHSDVSYIEENVLKIKISQEQFWKEERQSEGYQRELQIFEVLVPKLGVEKAVEVYKATQLYTVTLYGRINNSLRVGEVPKSAHLIDEYILAFSGKQKYDTLYRGVGKEFFNKLKEGYSYVEKGYSSTSSSIKTGVTFQKRKGAGGLFTIKNTKNKGAPAPLSWKMNNKGEQEILLPRNTKFNIVKIEGNNALLTIE